MACFSTPDNSRHATGLRSRLQRGPLGGPDRRHRTPPCRQLESSSLSREDRPDGCKRMFGGRSGQGSPRSRCYWGRTTRFRKCATVPGPIHNATAARSSRRPDGRRDRGARQEARSDDGACDRGSVRLARETPTRWRVARPRSPRSVEAKKMFGRRLLEKRVSASRSNDQRVSRGGQPPA